MRDTTQMPSDLGPMGEETLRVAVSVLALCSCFWLTCLSCCPSLQVAALFPRPTPFGGDHVQREHASLPAADAVWQIPQCAGGDQPWGPRDFSFSVSLKVTLLAKEGYLLHSPYWQSNRCLKTKGGRWFSIPSCHVTQSRFSLVKPWHPLCLNFPSAPCGDTWGQSVWGLWGLLQDSMCLLSLDLCCATFTAWELPVHSPSLTLFPPQGLWEWSKISTAVLLTVLHLWVYAGASEMLSLLSNMTTGSFSLSPWQNMHGLSLRAEWSWPGF